MTYSNLLLKIANVISDEKSLDQKLFNSKTKQTAIKYIYKKVDNLITGFFHDSDWQNVIKVFNAIKSLGVDLQWGVKDGGYHDVKDGQGNVTSKYKQYDLQIKFDNCNNKTIVIKGNLIATDASDSEDDPFSRYDIALILN